MSARGPRQRRGADGRRRSRRRRPMPPSSRDLAQVNVVTLAARPTLAFLDARRPAGRTRFRLLDVGFGDGDMLRRIARWAAASAGVDGRAGRRRPQPAQRAGGARAYAAGMPIRYVTGDYADLAGEPWDVIVSSLVAHHMTPRRSWSRSCASWRRMRAVGWLVNDLHRHGFAHRGFRCSRGSRAGIRSCATTARCRSRAAIAPPNGRRSSPRPASPMRACHARLSVPAVRRTLACALIVGGGPAGAAAAIALARAGAPHLLVERSARDRRCAVRRVPQLAHARDACAALGVEADDAQPRARDAACGSSPATGRARRRCPRPALGVSRRRLDTLLLAAPRAAGRGDRARRHRARDRRSAPRDSPTARRSPRDALFLASGKHDVRGLARPTAARGADPTLGLRVRLGAASRARPAGRRRDRAAPVRPRLCRAGACRRTAPPTCAWRCTARGCARRAIADAAARARSARSCPRLGERLALRRTAPIDAVANVPYGWRASDRRGGAVPARRSGRRDPVARGRRHGHRASPAACRAARRLCGAADADIAAAFQTAARARSRAARSGVAGLDPRRGRAPGDRARRCCRSRRARRS